MLMYEVDRIEYYSKNMSFLYSFDRKEIPENCEDKILKFNIYNNENETILEVIEK